MLTDRRCCDDDDDDDSTTAAAAAAAADDCGAPTDWEDCDGDDCGSGWGVVDTVAAAAADRCWGRTSDAGVAVDDSSAWCSCCLLYTSDAADE